MIACTLHQRVCRSTFILETSLDKLHTIFVCPRRVIGTAAVGSPLHVDPTIARTLLIAMVYPEDPFSLSDICAYWLFIRPTHLQEALNAARRITKGKKNFMTNESDARPLTHKEMKRLQRMLPAGACYIIPQRHGQMITVPAGWAHMVVNVLPCIKVALEGVHNEDLSLYAISHAYIKGKFPPLIPIDYPCWLAHTAEFILAAEREITFPSPPPRQR